MFAEWYKPNSCLEFPRGGSQAMVNALVRSVLHAVLYSHKKQIIGCLFLFFTGKRSSRRGTPCSVCVLSCKQKSVLMRCHACICALVAAT